MNPHDKQLIEQAKKVQFYDEVEPLEAQAESEEAKRKLHNIKMRKYHFEEYGAGCL